MNNLDNGNKSCKLNSEDLSILVISYDGAEELWKPFSQAWKQNWSDCPFETILTTQDISHFSNSCFDRIISVPSKATQAIYRIKEALKQVQSKYILVMCDDYFLYERPDENKLIHIIDMMREKKISCVHLDNKRKNIERLESEEIKNNSFLVSGGVPSIYERDFIYMLCERFLDCTMREWELNASRWLQKERYVIRNITNSSFKCHHCVLEGYWRVKPYVWAQKSNLEISFGTYKKPRILHSIWAVGKAVCFNIVLKVFPKIYNKWSQKKYS